MTVKGTALGIPALMEHAPEVDEYLGAFRAAASATVDPRLVELCRVRIAMLHDCGPELDTGPDVLAPAERDAVADWATSTIFDDRDRACLALAEQFVIDVSTTSDDQVAAVAAHLTPAELYGFVHALLALDEAQRLAVATDRLFGSGGQTDRGLS